MATRAWDQIDNAAPRLREHARRDFAVYERRVADVVPAESAPVNASLPYGARRGINWPAIAAAVLIHAIVLFFAIKLDVIHVAQIKAEPLVVTLIPETPPPPPSEPAKFEPQKPVVPVVAPRAIVPPPVSAPIIATPVPLPPQDAIVVPAAAAPAPSTAPVSVGDLTSKLIAGNPPKYPMESRRKRERGVVELMILIGTDGRVQDVSVQHTSGFARLDQAALSAVRDWRFSPTIRSGQPVMVRGPYNLAFNL